jgi:hypothetical protein
MVVTVNLGRALAGRTTAPLGRSAWFVTKMPCVSKRTLLLPILGTYLYLPRIWCLATTLSGCRYFATGAGDAGVVERDYFPILRESVLRLVWLQEFQGVGGGRVEGFLDHFEVDELLIHGGPAGGGHLAQLSAGGIVACDETTVT